MVPRHIRIEQVQWLTCSSRRDIAAIATSSRVTRSCRLLLWWGKAPPRHAGVKLACSICLHHHILCLHTDLTTNTAGVSKVSAMQNLTTKLYVNKARYAGSICTVSL